MVCLNIVDNANLSIVATRLPLLVQHITTTFTLTSPDTSHMTPLSRQTSPSSPQLIIIHAGPSSNHLKALRKQRWFWMAAILHCLKSIWNMISIMGGQTHQDRVMTAYFSLHLFAITNHVLRCNLGTFGQIVEVHYNEAQTKTEQLQTSESNVAKVCQKAYQA